MKKYKNRTTLFSKLHAIHKELNEMIENNQHLLVAGVETTLLKSAKTTIRTITKSKYRRELKE